MTKDELLAMEEGPLVVLCKDGLLGLLLLYPTERSPLCGIQVSGEDLHRYVPLEELTGTREGALRQQGAPRFPPVAIANKSLLQRMLAVSWATRGGLSLPTE